MAAIKKYLTFELGTDENDIRYFAADFDTLVALETAESHRFITRKVAEGVVIICTDIEY